MSNTPTRPTKVPSPRLAKLWEPFNWVPRCTVFGVWFAMVFLLVSCLLTNAGLISETSLLAGASYVPEMFLYPLLVLTILCLWATGRIFLMKWLVYFSVVYLVCLGDFTYRGVVHSLQRLLGSETPIQGVARVKVSDLGVKFSVLSLNLRYFSFGYKKITEELQRSDVDFVLLSENVGSAQETGFLTQNSFGYFMRMGKQSETGVLSKYPIVGFREVELPVHQASLEFANGLEEQELNQKRSFVHIIANVHGQLVHLISVRFVAGRAPSGKLNDALKWGKYLLKAQKAEVDFFEQYIANIHAPLVFGGDLNATPGSFVVQRLRRVATDAWLDTHFWGTPTFSTMKVPFITLDYLFAKNGAVPVDGEKLKMMVSDHQIVSATFYVPFQKSKNTFAHWQRMHAEELNR